MTKKFFSLLLALAIVCGTMCALPMTSSAAESGTCGDNLTWTLDDSGTLTISGTGEMRDYYYDDPAPWYSSRGKIVTVIIDGSVQHIGEFAFYGCTSLKNIEVKSENAAYTSINGILFNKDKTTLLCYPAGKTETKYTIPDGVTNIGEDAFYNCASLKSVTIPDSVTVIGDYAFWNCTSLTSVTIPDSVTSIGFWAFNDCTSLKSVTIPDSVTSIGAGAFNFTAYYNEPSNWTRDVLYIGNHLIATETSLDGAFSIRAGTKTIAGSALNCCTSLTNITIPDSVTSIGDYAFNGCTSLTSVNIPDGVTSIGVGAFNDCSSLTNIQVQTENPAYTSIDDILFNKGKTELLCYPASKAETNYIIPNSVTSISSSAFDGCSSLTSVTIPDGVTSIGVGAFRDCSSLTSITIPDNVTSVGVHAFLECDKCTIYGNNGSYAQTYAKEHNIPFVILSPVNDIFSDIVPDEWYVSAVQYAVDNKLFFGVSDNEFAPDEAMNRAMLVTVLWRLEGKPTASAENKFTDVPAGEWYTNAVIWASENGVVYGTSEKEFSPDDSITREQMATILYRYAKNKGYDVTASMDIDTFPDGKTASSYARGSLMGVRCGLDLRL